jgi:hypothetical protein
MRVELDGALAALAPRVVLSQVKLSNALNALCDTAGCSWTFDGSLHVVPQPSDRMTELPPRVSLMVADATLAEAFRAFAEAFGIPVMLDPGLIAAGAERVNWNFRNAASSDVLNLMCYGRCKWTFAGGVLRISARQ